MKRIRHQHGAALVLSLIVLVVVAGLGITTMRMATFQVKITNNTKQMTKSFALAETALEEARVRYDVVEDNSSADSGWRHYIGTVQAAVEEFGYDPNNPLHSIDTVNVDPAVVIEYRHKTEWDMQKQGHHVSAPQYADLDGDTTSVSEASPGQIIRYGFANSGDTVASVFTTSGPSTAKTVSVITTVSHVQGARKVIQTEWVKNPGIAIQATLYAEQDMTLHGSSGSYSGVDECSTSPDIPPVYTLSPAITFISGNPSFAGDPANPVTGNADLNIVELINKLMPGANIITSDLNNATLGNLSNYEIFYSDTSNPNNVNGLKLQNVTGYGALLVDGDLVLGGNVNWNGIILVNGTVAFNGGGNTINLRGALLAVHSVDINGGLDMRYDSCKITKALDALPAIQLSWREI